MEQQQQQQQIFANTVTSSIQNKSLARHLSLLDLISIGVGGTIGSGIFVLCGVIANQYAGPSSILSWLLGGIAAFFSGCCYAELAIYFPDSTGSTYVFVRNTMGEFMGLLAASCLSLEYVVAGAAVARSWGDKLYLVLGISSSNIFVHYNAAAGTLSAISVIVLYLGVKETKYTTNVITGMKIILVFFMFTGGLFFFQLENLTPFFPMGIQGTLRGSTSSFFGYLGFDAVCCFTGEAIRPHTNMPRAVLLTIGIVTFLYSLSSLALVGMQPYQDIVGFAEAFRYNGYESMAQITAWGEIITLPIVVMISLMAQPRLLYAVAKDDLLPEAFTRSTSDGNLRYGICVSGFIMIHLSIFVPFTYLNDFISAGILLAFSMTDSSLILVRRTDSHSILKKNWSIPYRLQMLLVLFNFFSFLTGLSIRHVQKDDEIVMSMVVLVCVLGLLSISITILIAWTCPPIDKFRKFNNNLVSGVDSNRSSIMSNNNSSAHSAYSTTTTSGRFETPFMPYFPCIGIFINWILIAQLETIGFLILFLYLGMVTLSYIIYKNFFATDDHDDDNADDIIRFGTIELQHSEINSLTLSLT